MTKKYPCSKTCIHYHVCRYADGYTQTPCKYEEHFTSINTGTHTFIAEDIEDTKEILIMTNEEAIKQLEWVKKRISNITYSPESFEALNLAIKSLEFINENFPERFKDYLNGNQLME